MTELKSLLYISRSRIDPADAEAEVGRIVAAAEISNGARGLTGALLFTGTHFAQVVEGAATDIDALMGILNRDPRHDRLIVVDCSAIAERRFVGWNMAYQGPSQFVARYVTRLLNDPGPSDKARATEWLTELMREFVDK